MRQPPLHRRAFATITVIVMLGLVTTALAALLVTSRLDYRRTQSSITTAQIRQLLLAATIDANHRAIDWGNTPAPQSWTLNEPEIGSAKMELTAPKSDDVRIRITAVLGTERAAQTLEYSHVDSHWDLVSVGAD